VDTICALAVAMGADFAIFVPSVRKPMLRHHVHVRHFFYKLIGDLDLILWGKHNKCFRNLSTYRYLTVMICIMNSMHNLMLWRLV
jgi:hypothetical protein